VARLAEPSARPARGRRWTDPKHLPLYVVAVAVLFGLIALWPEQRSVWYLNDATVHQSMVRWAADRMRAGHLPFDGWYPYLSLGASRFHHYQSLPHILTAMLSLAFGDGTFRWSLYLLLSLWPISVYLGARLLGLGAWPAAAAALISPLLSSAPGLGYEWSSYVWRGSGTWAQLWGMWALPLAWGLSWRAVAKGKQLWLAAVVLGVTVCLHLLTGYLALLCLGVFVIVTPSEFLARLRRAAIVGVVALAASAWMLVPLITGARWTINDEFSRGTKFYDSFGAWKIMRWFGTGRLFDTTLFFNGWLPVITILVGVGLVLAVVDFRRRESSRVLLGLGLLSLLLFFGRPTLGPALKLLPGGGDLFLRRYIMGVHLAGIYLGGLGLTWCAERVGRSMRTKLSPDTASWRPAFVAGAVLMALLPASVGQIRYIAKDWTWIPQQQRAQSADGQAYAALVQRAQTEGPGRIFSERRSGRTSSYRVGFVPAYAVLLNLRADAVGFTRPTWSLASGAEFRFDINQPGLPDLFGVRYVIYPGSSAPPSGAVEVASSGRHVLYEFPDVGYVSLIDTIAPITVDRNDLGKQMSSFMSSGLPARGLVPTLAFGGRPAATPTLGANQEPDSAPGTVVRSSARPADGVFEADVEALRPAVVLVKASFDPRFEAVVDGVPVPIQMVAPALVGVPVPPGSHHVSVIYHAYPWYGPLFALGIAAVLLLWASRFFGSRLIGMNRSLPVAVLVSLSVLVVASPACRKTPIDPDVRLQQGLAAQRAGDLDGASDAYEDVLNVRPNDTYALYNLGVIAQGDGVTGLAEGYYRSALDADPDFEPALFNLAIIRTSVGATQEAIDLYRRLLVVAPENANAHFNLAILLQRSGEDKEATAEFNVAIKIDPSLAGRLATDPILPGDSDGDASPTATPSATAPP
jgi:hypothetical protein